MSTVERFSSIIGVALLGFAAYLVTNERKSINETRQPTPPVEELGEKLKAAWAGHHNA